MKKRSKKLLVADAFRARVMELRAKAHVGWRDWEADWLDSQARRYEDYIHTDKERVVLRQLIAAATFFTQFSDYNVQEMVRMVYPYRPDLDEASEDFVVKLYGRGATALSVRHISRLANLCRMFERLNRDELVDEVMRATCSRENEEVELESVEYA